MTKPPLTQQHDEAEEGFLVNQQRLVQLVEDTLPVEEIVHCFGYGSGVFSQQLDSDAEEPKKSNNNNKEAVLVDLIVVVRDAQTFHQQNYQRNPSHYWTPSPSWLLPRQQQHPSEWFTSWQRDPPGFLLGSCLGQNPGVYFNVTDSLKYGVVQVGDLLDDLLDWKYLYLAGRLHKPTLSLPLDNSHLSESRIEATSLQQQLKQRILQAQQQSNIPAALSVALLSLGHNAASNNNINQTEDDVIRVSEVDVYRSIAELSYRGDVRVHVGAEDPLKISKLVQSPGQLPRFRALYRPVLQQLQSQWNLEVQVDTKVSNDHIDSHGKQHWTWDARNPHTQEILQSQLPPSLRPQNNLKETGQHQVWMTREIDRRVARSARYQSFKGLVTAGPAKAFQYAARKWSKGILRFAARKR